MDMKELNYIVAIADAGSISAAAEKLFMAQSSLSQALSLYESELGTPIFVRTSRGVRPTPSGSVFISHARQILNHYRLAQSEVWDIEGLNGGRVEFGISSFRGTYLLPPALKQFHASYPQIQVEITELDSWDLEDRILKGLLDIALIAAPSEKIRHSCDFLMKDEIVCKPSCHGLRPSLRPTLRRILDRSEGHKRFHLHSRFSWHSSGKNASQGAFKGRRRAGCSQLPGFRPHGRRYGQSRAGAGRHLPLLYSGS